MNNEYMAALEAAYQNILNSKTMLQPGLTDVELRNIEIQLQFAFSPDLKWLLKKPHPAGRSFIDWKAPFDVLQGYLGWPIESICFDVQKSSYWRSEWGKRPASPQNACEIAANAVKRAPKLIPITKMCFVPSSRSPSGLPVFSIHQTDIIHRGANLAEFIAWFFRDDPDDDYLPVYSKNYTEVDFWSLLTYENYVGIFGSRGEST